MLSLIKKTSIYYENSRCDLAKVFFKYVNWAIKKINPIIEYEIYGKKVLIPYTHNLPNILNKHKMYSYNLKRIADHCKVLFSDFSVIDIGANIGDTSILLNNVDYPMLCVEGDLYFFDLLVKNTGEYKTTCVNCLVSDDVSKELYISSKHGSGRVNSNGIVGVKSGSLDDLLLKKNNNFKKSKLLKIDTDGFDMAVLRSAYKYVKSVRPIIFLEFDPYLLRIQEEDPLNIFTFLKDLGYANIIIYDNFGNLVMSLDLNNESVITDLILYFSSRKNGFYADICFFHENNNKEFGLIFEKEFEYYSCKE